MSRETQRQRLIFLTGIASELADADERGEIGECCANPYCRACTVLSLVDDMIRAARVELGLDASSILIPAPDDCADGRCACGGCVL